MSTTNEDSKPVVRTYSLRAECVQDLEALVAGLREQMPHMLAIDLIAPVGDTPQDKMDPDRQLEFRTTLEFQEIQEVIGKIEDSHVMSETLKELPLSENDLERTHEDNPHNAIK